MKNVKITLLMLACLAISLPNFAAPNPGADDSDMIVRTEVVGEKAIQLQLVNLQKQTTRVAITSLDGNVRYYRDYIYDHNGYMGLLHLDKLDPGRYLLEVQNGEQTETIVMKIEPDQVLVSA